MEDNLIKPKLKPIVILKKTKTIIIKKKDAENYPSRVYHCAAQFIVSNVSFLRVLVSYFSFVCSVVMFVALVGSESSFMHVSKP